MKSISLIVIVIFFSSCQGSEKKSADVDPCQMITEALSGSFQTNHMEGTMTWSGGLSGTVEISGLDYNDMTCTYTIPDCTTGVIQMNCNGAGYNTNLIVFSKDSMQLGPTAYSRAN